MTGGRLDAFRHPRAQHGLVHHAGIDALEPIIPPPKHLLQEADLRAGPRKMRIPMCPRPDEPLARNRQPLEKAWNRILIGIGPTADGVYGALDRLVILADRSMLPISIAPLVLQPELEEQRYVLQPLQPHRPPAVADKHRVGWQAYRSEKERGPFKSGGEQRAAHVVCIVGVAIVSRADGDDRLERGRTSRRDLKPVEAAPGDSHHPDDTAAPGLRGQPRDHLQAVVLLLLRVLVEQQPP